MDLAARLIELGLALALIAAGTAWSTSHLAATRLVWGVRTSAIALVLPIFGPAGYATIESVRIHHSLRTIIVGFSFASSAALLIGALLAIYLGIRSINARVFQYFLLAIPVAIVSEFALSDGRITPGEGELLIASYVAFVLVAWCIDRARDIEGPAPEERPVRSGRRKFLRLTASCAVTVVGSALLIDCARSFAVTVRSPEGAESIAALGVFAQILVLVYAGMRSERAELASSAIVGSLVFNSAMSLGIFGLMARHKEIEAGAYAFAAAATVLVPSILFPLAFKQIKHLLSRSRENDAQLDNIFAWRNLKRDLSNYQLLRYRWVGGNLVTGMNSGTHWLTVMLATAIAKQHNLALPKYFSFNSAGDLVGVPSALVRRPGVPAIALSHNHPAAPVSWPITRRLVSIPKQVVLVRDIREVLVSAYVKWMPGGEIPFSEFVRGDPANRRGYLCDVWWYLSYLNRWGDFKMAAPDETLIVRYEDLVADPAFWLRRIGDHLGLGLCDSAIAAAMALRDKEAAIANLEPGNSERVIASEEAKAAVKFSEEDMTLLRAILSRHLRYDYGYDYGIDSRGLISVRAMGPLGEPRYRHWLDRDDCRSREMPEAA